MFFLSVLVLVKTGLSTGMPVWLFLSEYRNSSLAFFLKHRDASLHLSLQDKFLTVLSFLGENLLRNRQQGKNYDFWPFFDIVSDLLFVLFLDRCLGC